MVLARLFFFFPFFTGVGVSKHKIGTWAFMRVGMFSEQSYVIINKPLKSLLNHASIWIFKTSAFLSSSCFFFFFHSGEDEMYLVFRDKTHDFKEMPAFQRVVRLFRRSHSYSDDRKSETGRDEKPTHGGAGRR